MFLESIPAIIGVVSAVFTFDVEGFLASSADLVKMAIGQINDRQKDWYDKVNSLQSFINQDF